jgi:GAF domain-containing protein
MALYYAAKKPPDEQARLDALAEFRILGTRPEQCYDDITTIASITCGAPIALMSLVARDSQWFKAKVGIEAMETPRDWSFCAHAIHSPQPMVVEDALFDRRFQNNPLVTGDPKIRMYAGFPLETCDAHRLGTLCIIDRKPGMLTTAQTKVMQALARQVVTLLELRRRTLRLLDGVGSLCGDQPILPICSYCRKVRDGDGDWQFLDQYLSRHSKLGFSHGICDHCMNDHFPDVVDAWSQENLGPKPHHGA